MKKRTERLGVLLKKEISYLIAQEDQEKMGMATLVDVVATDDLKQATIYLSVLDKAGEKNTLKFLEQKKYAYQNILSHKLKLRSFPKLKFTLDHSVEQAQKIEELLNREK